MNLIEFETIWMEKQLSMEEEEKGEAEMEYIIHR